jgi:regulator of protease activity HflC (stomatin/prohibitin superfamily)
MSLRDHYRNLTAEGRELNEIGMALQKAREYISRKAVRYGIYGSLALIAATCSTKNVGGNEIAMRVNTVDIPGIMKQGIADSPSGPGIHFAPPFITRWYTLPTKAQTMYFTNKDEKREGTVTPPIVIKARDGNDVMLSGSLTWSIIQKEAPKTLHRSGQSIEEIAEKIVLPVTRSVARDLMGVLNSQGIYNASERSRASEVATERLREALKPYGISADILVFDAYDWLNDKYGEIIDSKVHAEANVITLRSKIGSQPAVNERLLSTARATINQIVATADGEFQRDSLAANAYRDSSATIAAAIRTEGRNIAAGIASQRQAMNSSGGETEVRMRLAEALAGKPIYMMPTMGNGTFQTFNMNDFLSRLGIQSVIENGGTPPAGPVKK